MVGENRREEFPRFYAQVSLDRDEVAVKHIEELAKYDIVTLSSGGIVLGNAKPDGEPVRRIKSVNSDTIVLCYLSLTDLVQGNDLYEIRTKHPDWLLRDKKGNPCRAYNKVKEGNFPSGTRWALDPRSDWKKFFARRSLEVIEAGYDGIFADNTWKYYNWEPCNYWELDMTNDEWIEAWAGFLGYVKGELQDKLLICNGDPVKEYLENSDGDMLESFMKMGIRNFWDELERAKLISGMGKILINHASYENEMTIKTNLFKWYYTCSLLTDGYFSYTIGFDFWHPEFGIKLGAPKGEYYEKDSIYQRDYERAKVMVNPTLKDFRVKLEDEFRLWGKKKVKEVELPAYSGVLLQSL